MNRISRQRGSNPINGFVIGILLITCFVTNISQMSMFVDSGLSSRVSIIAWVICFAFVILSGKMVFRVTALNVYVASIVFLALIAINSLFTSNDYWGSSHVYSLFISLFVFTVGCLISNYIDEERWNKLIWIYVISSCIVALEVYINYFARGFNISSRIYAYDSKNSFSQILLTSIVLLIFGMSNEQKKKYMILRRVIIVLLFILIALMKARATMVGFGVLYVAFLTNKDIKRKYKFWSVAALLVALFAVIEVPSIHKLVIDDILLAGRSITDLNDLSSGRITIIARGLEQIRENLIWGIGGKYLDCYPIATVLQFGLVAGVVLWFIALLPLFLSLKVRRFNTSSEYYNVVTSIIVLSITYIVNGLFECLTPLGPGVKCFFLWLALGIITNARDITLKNFHINGQIASTYPSES